MSSDTIPSPPPAPTTLDEILATLARVQEQRDTAQREAAELRALLRTVLGPLHDARKVFADIEAARIELEKAL